MQLPNWVPAHGGITAFAILAQLFMSGGDLSDTSGSVFEVVVDAITFQTFSDLPDWFGWLLFFVLSVPWFLLLAAYVFMAFNNAVTGAVVGTAIIVALALTIGLNI